MKKNYGIYIGIILLIIISLLSIFTALKTLSILEVPNILQSNAPNINKDNVEFDDEHIKDKLKVTKVNINAVGDCTLGYDDNFGYPNSFNNYYDKYGEDYFFKGVKEIFASDDFTFANLETTFTNALVKTPKKFNFKAPLNYVNILKKSSIEVVNIANNHIKDYGEDGYNETIDTLKNANVNFIGYDYYYVFKKNDIKIGLGGIHCIETMKCTEKIDKIINDLKELNVDGIILSFHWGIEKDYKQSTIQTKLAHYAIDNGANLILGHHPHVLQGIELYKDSYIVYSLANFSFGGNKNPKDKDTMVFNIEYTFENKKITNTKVKIYPTRVSSVKNTNDYSPTLLTSEEGNLVLDKIQKNSVNFNVYEHID